MSASGAAFGSPNHDDFRGEPLRSDEMEAFRLALSAAGLPADDIASPDVQPFRFTRNLKPVGYGALEVFGCDALMRSIVVAPEARGDGLGRKIVEGLLAEASRLGVQRAFLFTTDARAYFEGLGFQVVDRSLAPTIDPIDAPGDRALPGVGCAAGARVSPSSHETDYPESSHVTITIYHNPACGTSRNVLAMIRRSGEEPVVIEYLKTPPTRERLKELIAAMGVPVRSLLREKERPTPNSGSATPNGPTSSSSIS